MEIIEVQYRDRHDESFEGADLSEKWDEITETPGVTYARYRAPKRNGDGYRVKGIYGQTRDEQAAYRAERDTRREAADHEALRRMYAARTWEWFPGNTDSHL